MFFSKDIVTTLFVAQIFMKWTIRPVSTGGGVGWALRVHRRTHADLLPLPYLGKLRCGVVLLFVAEDQWGASESINRIKAPQFLWREFARDKIAVFWQEIFELSHPQIEPS